MLGWDKGSWGYHGDDGKLFISGEWTSYGRLYAKGNIVGCGVDFDKEVAFFTLNGKYLGEPLWSKEPSEVHVWWNSWADYGLFFVLHTEKAKRFEELRASYTRRSALTPRQKSIMFQRTLDKNRSRLIRLR